MKEGHRTAWEDLYRIKIRNPDDSMQQHEVVKLLLVMKLLKHHLKDRRWIRIYTEFPVTKGKIADVYYENLKKNEACAFEIQKNASIKWITETNNKYNEWDSMIFHKRDWQLIDLNQLSNNIEELNRQLDKFII